MLDVSRWDDRRFGESGRRIAVWTVVLACHVGFLVLLLAPANDDSKASTPVRNLAQALQLRFITLQSRLPLPAGSIAPHPVAEPRREPTRARLSAKASITLRSAVRPSLPAAQQPADPPITISVQEASTMSPSPAQRAPEPGSDIGSDSDGGFQARLRDAQHGSDVHGVPGSDKALVQGIRLVDPMDQGIGAAARTAQRLFGIKSRECIDVETWRSLTPQELSARHISPDQVDREDEKYRCNDPPGLHF